MNNTNIIRLREYPHWAEAAAEWFSSRWEIPKEAYQESMQCCIAQQIGVPQWYIVQNTQGEMIAGAGVIENDFHNRKDLTPNLCAVFVEEGYRRQGIMRSLLAFILEDLQEMGIPTVYLVTDHTELYEKCGWEFFTMVEDEEGNLTRMYRTTQ